MSADGEPNAVLAAVSSLTYSYAPNGPLVLRDISLSVREGEVVVLTGPSGSGKTTLLSLMGLLRRAPAGHIQLFNIDIGTAGDSDIAVLRRRIRFVFQKHYLLRSLTVLQNVMAGVVGDATSERDWNRTRAMTLLEKIGLADEGGKWPDQLSGGQQQRVAVARALVGFPDLLLADEPTSSLDRASAQLVVEHIRTHAATLRCGVLISTHDERIVDVATRHLHIEDGVLLATSGPG